MVNQFVLNLLVAFVWASLQAEFTTLNFTAGFVLGAVLIRIFYAVSGAKENYVDRLLKAVKLLLIFLWELVVASVQVVRLVLSPGLNFKPGIIGVPLDVKTDLQITLLASMISLTPGTISMYVSKNNDCLYIHVMDIHDKEKIIAEIKNTFEKGIKEVAGE